MSSSYQPQRDAAAMQGHGQRQGTGGAAQNQGQAAQNQALSPVQNPVTTEVLNIHKENIEMIKMRGNATL